jgi:hypothetical protein
MDIVIVLILIIGLYLIQRSILIQKTFIIDGSINQHYFDILFGVHLFFGLVYLLYAYATRSDAGEYYRLTVQTKSWGLLFQPGTIFIRFLCYPFSNILGLSYEAVMFIFTFLGFQGILLFYLAARENIPKASVFFGGMTLLEFLFLLPNCHFWSASLGKGSVMIFAIGLTFYGLSRFNTRLKHLIIGAVLVYMVRSHMLLAIIVGIGSSLFFSISGIKWYFRYPLVILSFLAVFLISDNVLENTGAESLNIFDSKKIEHRAKELGKGNSGLDLANYNQGFKLFTFLYRPLFVDAPGIMGIISSFENVFILFLTIQFLINFPLFWTGSTGFHKIAFFVFLLSAISLAQISGNLGLAIRQKSQIFPLLFFVIAFSNSFQTRKD